MFVFCFNGSRLVTVSPWVGHRPFCFSAESFSVLSHTEDRQNPPPQTRVEG